MTVEPAVTAQTLAAGVPPLTLQATLADVTSVTGLLFGGWRIQAWVDVEEVGQKYWRVV